MKVEILVYADTDIVREVGLMWRKPLKMTECAFFDFEKVGSYSFWNKNVPFPISLIFCDSEFNVKKVGYLNENQLNPVSSGHGIRYVIEAHKDLPSKIDLKEGKKIEIKDGEVVFS